MNQDQLMQQLEDQFLDELNDEPWEWELKELVEQEEEEMYMQYLASMWSY